MNAKQGDYKCGDRINTLPNTHGCYDGLWRKSVLINFTHRAWPFRRNHINENCSSIKSGLDPGLDSGPWNLDSKLKLKKKLGKGVPRLSGFNAKNTVVDCNGVTAV